MPGLCIVSRDYPMLFGYLVLAYGRQGSQDVDVIMDRRHGHGSGREPGSARLDRRVHHEIEEALRLQGYAIVEAGRKGGRRQIELAPPPEAAALPAGESSDFIGDDRPVRTPRGIIAGITLGAIVLGLFVIMVASEDVVGGAARAAVAVIEWVRGDGAAKTASAPNGSPPAATAPKAPAASETRTAPPLPSAARPPEPAAAVPSPTLPPPATLRAAAPSAAAPAPAPSPTSGTTARPTEEPSREATRTSAPAWSGLPKVELSTQPTGSGAKRGLAYTVKLSDTEGRPLSGADVWLRVAMPDRSEQETKLTAGDPPGTYRGRLAVGTRSPEVSRVRIGIGGTRVEVPVSQPR